MSSSTTLVIAIDGPAASGKGTLARHIAEHYGLAHLDTGALYRAVAFQVLRGKNDPSDKSAAIEAAHTLDPEILQSDALRTDEVGKAASVVAAMPEVREAILDYQRNFAKSPPGGQRGAVLDGRDIGTVVCPDAPVKFFITATVDARTDRRYQELSGKGLAVTRDEVKQDLIARDRRDEDRDISPLRQDAHAHLLDTTKLSIEAAFAAVRAIIDETL